MESRDADADADPDTFDPSALSGTPIGFDYLQFDSLEAFDDNLAFTDNLGLDEGHILQPDGDQESPPYDGNLYSTPLSWDPSVPKVEPFSQSAAPYVTMNVLTAAQQEKLRKIAMPQHLKYPGHQSPNSPASTKSQSVSSPDNNDRNRKRKSSAEVDDEDDEDSNPPVKKTAHNMIEKRYRTNLNDKIAALRDSVPSLRIMTKSARGEDTADDREELQGLTPAHKLNKATVLSKATEYIQHLEKRNQRLHQENMEQNARLAAFEILFRSGSMGLNAAPPMNQFQYPPTYSTPGHSPVVDPQGMIQIPEDIRRLHSQANQQTYAVPQEHYQQNGQAAGANGWPNGGGYFGKLMVGSLAGLMIIEGFSETEQDSDSPDARGLFALPTPLLRTLSRAVHSSLNINVLGYHVSAAQSLGYMKILLVFGAMLYAFLPALFNSKPRLESSKSQTPAAAPSLASSIQVRRQAWLTAIQTVWVPRHNFFLEAAALCSKMAKLSIRNVVGAHGYTYLTGITEQQEAARVKAWTIALDAQLTGGDVEVSKSRLTLTLLASGTLPDTPARLMLKALHIQVLLWEVGNAGFNGFYMFHEVAAKLARWKWNQAKQLQRLMVNTKSNQEDTLPEYLAALLDQESDDVFVDSISQRAYNLAWNLPTIQNVDHTIDGMNGVVEDFAIRSPLDAVAAWYSSLVLQRALSRSLESREDDIAAQTTILEDITLAIKTAPIGSEAQIRALVARAVLFKEKRGASIAESMQALGPLENPNSKKDATSTFIHANTSMAGLPDIKMSLRCAMAIAHLERFPSPAIPAAAPRIISTVSPVKLTLLGFTAAFKLMEKIDGHEVIAVSCAGALERLAGNLRIWVGGKKGENSGLDSEVKRAMVEKCLGIAKRVVGMQDAGYGSMSEEDVGEGC